MDIQQANDILTGFVITKQKELDAVKLAISILQDKFEAEFTSKDEAMRQLNVTAETLNNVETAKAQLESEKSNLEQQKASLELQVEDKNAVIISKESEIEEILTDKSNVESVLLEKEALINSLVAEKEVIQNELDALKTKEVVVDVIEEPIP